MIKYLILLFLISCSSSEKNPDDVNDNQSNDIPEPKQLTDASVSQKKICKLFDVVKVKECKLYYFVCEDFSIEMSLVCPVVPVGTITNPPRPIKNF